jgi:hypothetical protein
VLNDHAIRSEAEATAGDDAVLRDELAQQWIVAVALHELAHVLQQPLSLDTPATSLSEEREGLLAAWCRQPIAVSSVPWQGHDAKFIRVLCHVLHRAEQAGIDRVPRSVAFPNHAYGLSNLEQYEAKLQAELDTFTGTFAELQKTPPPAEFVTLWRQDVQHYIQSLSAVPDLVSALVDGITLYPEVNP